ncbi:PucR family transcriptional regulator [Microtetraspora malaysiensis]|uniref:PucR family transcriptional regulator n=1 Tax=Microtetraspora malaysiensis TaxID=161358 RepID=UPI00083029D3|nr:PucR family transcriptional regulator [Microtetraspora malaysiensis]
MLLHHPLSETGQSPAPSSATSGFTLPDLLAVKEFNLVLHTGDEAALAKPVLGAHSIDIPNPTRWLPARWIVLTTGLSIRGAAKQRELVQELAGAGMAALGYAAGINTRNVPAALVDEARKLNFPVFTVPHATHVYLVIDYVRRSVLRNDPQFLQQIVDTHAYLTGSGALELADRLDEPMEQAILRRVGSLLNAQVGLLDALGSQTWLGEKALSQTSLNRLLNGKLDAPAEFAEEGSPVHALPIRRDNRHVGWLVVRWHDIAHENLLPLAWAAANLISFVYDTRSRASDAVAVLRAELFDRLLKGTGHLGDLSSELRQIGFTGMWECRVVLLGARSDHSDAAHAFQRALRHASIPFLLRSVQQSNAFFVQAELPQLLDLLRAVHGRAYVGRPVTAPSDLALSMHSAEFVMRATRDRDGAKGVAVWDELPMTAWMLSTQEADQSLDQARKLLEPLEAQPLVLEAVVAFLRCNLDVVAAARMIHLHPNSFRYRLSRAEDLLGAPLRQPSVVADLYAALVLIGQLEP